MARPSTLCHSVVAGQLLTWIGDVMALLGGMAATVSITDMTPTTYLATTRDVITLSSFVAGMVKMPFLALAIGLVACAQGLATRGGRRGWDADDERGRHCDVHVDRD